MPRARTINIGVTFAAINLDGLAETCHELPGPTLYGTQTELIEESYFIYERLGTVVQLWMVPAMGGLPRYCLIMEFDQNGMLHKLESTSCNVIMEFQLKAIRTEANQGKIDSAAVLAVYHGEPALLENPSAKNKVARHALSLITYGRSYDSMSLAGLTDAELRKRALEGDPEASYQLYWNTVTPESHVWLCRAADLGQHQARHRLGVLYENGSEGLRKGYLHSYKWYVLSAETGNYEAWIQVRLLKNEVLTGDAVTRANALVRSWQPGQCERQLAP